MRNRLFYSLRGEWPLHCLSKFLSLVIDIFHAPKCFEAGEWMEPVQSTVTIMNGKTQLEERLFISVLHSIARAAADAHIVCICRTIEAGG